MLKVKETYYGYHSDYTVKHQGQNKKTPLKYIKKYYRHAL